MESPLSPHILSPDVSSTMHPIGVSDLPHKARTMSLCPRPSSRPCPTAKERMSISANPALRATRALPPPPTFAPPAQPGERSAAVFDVHTRGGGVQTW
eukprot:875873-Prymnesium_polylepis.1